MMGLSPAQVGQETPETLWAAFRGFKGFHGIKDADGDLSDDEFLAILAAEQAAGRA